MKGETCFPVNVVRIFFFPSSSSPTSPVDCCHVSTKRLGALIEDEKKHLWIVVNKETRSPLIEDTKWSIYGLLWYFNKEMKSPHWGHKRIQLWIVVMFQQRDEDTKDFNSCLLQRSSSVFPSSPLLGILNRMRALYLQHHKCIFRLCCFGNFQLFPGLTSAVGRKIERSFIVGRTGEENVPDEERREP